MSKVHFPQSIFILFALLAGCNSNQFFQEKKDIPSGIWTYRDSLDFKFQVADTSQVYNLYLDVRFADTFPAQNLYVKLHTQFPNGKRPSKVVSLDLFDAQGESAGKCSGSTCSAHILLQEKAYFGTIGEYGLTVQQFMRRDSLRGISSLGLSIEKTKQRR